MNVSKNWLAHSLLSLLHYRDLIGRNGRFTDNAYNHVTRYWYKVAKRGESDYQIQPDDYHTVQLVKYLIDHEDWGNNTSHQIAEAVRVLMEGDLGDSHTGTLIDYVAKMVSKPYGANVLAGTALKELRKALITPAERVTLSARLQQTEGFCASCGRTLYDYEGVTYHQGKFLCGVCAHPRCFACAKCEGSATPHDRVLKAVGKKHICAKCQAGESTVPDETGATTVVQDAVTPTAADVTARFRTILGGGAGTARAGGRRVTVRQMEDALAERAAQLMEPATPATVQPGPRNVTVATNPTGGTWIMDNPFDDLTIPPRTFAGTQRTPTPAPIVFMDEADNVPDPDPAPNEEDE